MCAVREEDFLRSMIIMICGDALDYLDDKNEDIKFHDDELDLLRKWYQISEQHARLLAEWKTIRLTEEMRKSPDDY